VLENFPHGSKYICPKEKKGLHANTMIHTMASPLGAKKAKNCINSFRARMTLPPKSSADFQPGRKAYPPPSGKLVPYHHSTVIGAPRSRHKARTSHLRRGQLPLGERGPRLFHVHARLPGGPFLAKLTLPSTAAGFSK